MIDEGVLFALAIGVVVAVSIPGLYLLYQTIRRNDPETFEAMRRTITALSKRLDELEEQRQGDHLEITRMHTELGRVGLRLERWMVYAQRLAEIMRENGLTVPPSPEEQDDAASKATVLAEDGNYDTARLLRLMGQHFNIDELHDLAFQLNIGTGDLGGESFNAKARALIGNVQRNGRLAELVALCRQLRPNAKF